MRKLFALIGFCLLYVISIWVRVPYLNTSLGGHHEWVTCHSLIILNNWSTQGALNNKLCLQMNFPGDNNRGINHDYGRLWDREGNSYYVSFPPGSIIIPHLISKVLGFSWEPFTLKWINIFFHGLSGIFFYLILSRLILCRVPFDNALVFLGTFLYFFLPAHLWFFSNVYSWDIFWFYVQVFCLYFVLKIRIQLSENKPYGTSLLALVIGIFWLVYSDFYGLLFTCTAVLFLKKSYSKFNPAGGTVSLKLNWLWGAAFFGVLLTVSTYSSIAGMAPLLKDWFSSAKGYLPQGWVDLKMMWIYLWRGYWPILGSIFVLVWYALIIKRKSIGEEFSEHQKAVLFLTFVPAALFYTFVPGWVAEHTYATIRFSPFLIFLLVFLVQQCFDKVTWARRFLLVTFIVFLTIIQINLYKKYFAYPEKGDFCQQTAAAMKEHWQEGEVIFSINNFSFKVDPRYLYHLGQNVQTVENLQQAMDYLTFYNKPKGVIFFLDETKGFLEFERISNRDIEPRRNEE